MKHYFTVCCFMLIFSASTAQTPFISVQNSANGYFISPLSYAVMTPDSGYLTASAIDIDSVPGSIYKIVLAKLNANGIHQWSKSYESPVGLMIQQLISDNTGYLLCGYYYYPSGGNLFLMKLDQNGDSLWTQGYPQMFTGGSLYLRPDSSYISIGEGDYSGAGGSMQVRNIDTLGNVLWMHSYINSPSVGNSGLGPSGIVCSDGGFLFFVQGTVVAKLDSLGNNLWSTPALTYGNSFITAKCLAEFSDGSYLLVGDVHAGQTASAFMMKISTTGSIQWTKTVADGNQLTYFTRASTFSDGRMRIRGYTKTTFSGPSCDWMLSIDSTGSILSVKKICDPGGLSYLGYDFNESPFGGMITSGTLFDQTQSNYSFVVASHGVNPTTCNVVTSSPLVTPIALTNPQIITFTHINVPLTSAVDSSFFVSQNIYAQGNNCLTGVIEIDEFGKIMELYPNPTSGILNITFREHPGFTKAFVTDLSGKTILNFEINEQQMVLDVSSLAGGVYFMQITSDERNQILKFIRE